jgi:hypothetical protein
VRLVSSFAAIAVALVAAPQAAQATTYIMTKAALDRSVGHLKGLVALPGINARGQKSLNIGRMLLTGTESITGMPVSLKTYCADPTTVLRADNFTRVSRSSLSFDSDRLKAAGTFLANADPLVRSASDSAAVQLGLWEILFEGSGTSYDVNGGVFSASGGTLIGSGYDALATANGWLGEVASGAWRPDRSLELVALDPSADNQLQFYMAPRAQAAPVVPEPASWLTMLVGFAATGLALRSRRPARGAFD